VDAPDPLPLAGRVAEVEAIAATLWGVETGGHRVVTISGEAGIGKSRLLDELATRAEAVGMAVHRGRASEFERDVPFAVFSDALGDAFARQADRLRRALGDEAVAALQPAFAAFGAVEAGAAGGLQLQRSARAALDVLAAAAPVVVILDDLHWADRASLELVAHLVRRPPARPHVLALALRRGPAERRLRDWLRDADRAGTAVHLELEPLARADAGALLDSVDGAAGDALWAQAGGNPLLLTELLRHAHRHAAVEFDAAAVPPAISGLVAVELASLSPAARELAHGAAIAGDPCDPELAAAAGEVAARDVAAALDELLAVELLRPTDVPRRFAFRHPVIRRAVYEATGGGWRLEAHGRVAAALAARGAGPIGRAHHVAFAASPGDGAAVALLAEAARAVAATAPAIAARWLSSALALSAETDVEQRATLLADLGAALADSGRLPESHAALEESLALLPQAAIDRRVRATIALVGVGHLLGRYEEESRRLRDTLALLPDGTADAEAALRLELAYAVFVQMDLEAAGPAAQHALDAARTAGDAALLVAAEALVAGNLAWSGGPAAAGEHADRALARFDRLDDLTLARRPQAGHFLVYTLLWSGRLDEALVCTRRTLKVGRGAGAGALMLPLLVQEAAVLGHLGRLAEAAEAGLAAEDAARLAANRQFLQMALGERSLTALRRGDVAAGLALAEESVAQTAGLDPSAISRTASCLRGAALLEAGLPEEARHEILAAVGSPLTGIEPTWAYRFGWVLTRCELACGHDDEAARRVQALRASAPPLPLTRLFAELAHGEILLAAGDHPAAARCLTDAADANAATLPFDAAQARLLAGRALAADGQRDAAVQALEAAAAVFAETGAERLRAEAVRELRRLGRRIASRGPRAAGTTGLHALSVREREIAVLVAAGATNREIAGTLFLSEKTVEGHLSRIFGKLGVRSRAQVAAQVARAD
jgi:DNA-binding NarL/FixJ family response regulator